MKDEGPASIPPTWLESHDDPAALLLQRNQERLAAAISIAKLGTFEWDVGTGEVRLDDRSRRIFGFADGEGGTADEVFARIHPGDIQRVRELAEDSVRRGRPVDVEYRLKLPDGRVRHISSAGQMLRDAGGKAVQMFGVFADHTHRVQERAALRLSEARFRTIANAMPQMVWSTLPDGFHDYYNDRWYEYTGVPHGSTDGDAWNGMFHEEDQPLAWERWRHCLATGEPYEIEYRLRHHSGQYRWVLGRALPIRDEVGAIVRWMGTCTDIHDQKTLRDELTAMNRRKDEFLAMLAHELRNPLAPIHTAAYMLKAAPHDPARVERSAEIIGRQVRHMTSLVDDLLDVSRVTRGLVKLRKAPVDLKAVLLHAIEQVRPHIESRKHELATRSPADDAVVLGDEPRLVQIVTNVLANAAKYTPPGGHLSVVLAVEPGWARVEVADDGIGIEPELLPHLFELFTQGRRTPDRSQGGLGLGLALVKSLTDLHGGTIEARSGGTGKGSTFVIRFPLVDRAVQATEGDKAPTVPARGVRVMLVDDNVDAVETLAVVLEADGHQVTAVTDVQQALEVARRGAFEAYILDIGLPGMDGHELAGRLRQLPHARDATFIALSGYGQERDRRASLEAGFQHHHVKPLDPDVLRRLVAGLGATAGS